MIEWWLTRASATWVPASPGHGVHVLGVELLHRVEVLLLEPATTEVLIGPAQIHRSFHWSNTNTQKFWLVQHKYTEVLIGLNDVECYNVTYNIISHLLMDQTSFPMVRQMGCRYVNYKDVTFAVLFKTKRNLLGVVHLHGHVALHIQHLGEHVVAAATAGPARTAAWRRVTDGWWVARWHTWLGCNW